MRWSRFEWIITGAIVALLGIFWIAVSREPVKKPVNLQLTEAPIVGHLAPEFSLATPDGAEHSLLEHVDRAGESGKPVILNFWASWCIPCRLEMPYFQDASLAYADRAVVLGVNQGESAATVTDFGAATHVTYPLLVDQEMTVNNRYGINGLPTTVFIDAAGVVQEVFVGTMNQAVLESRIEQLLPDNG